MKQSDPFLLSHGQSQWKNKLGGEITSIGIRSRKKNPKVNIGADIHQCLRMNSHMKDGVAWNWCPHTRRKFPISPIVVITAKPNIIPPSSQKCASVTWTEFLTTDMADSKWTDGRKKQSHQPIADLHCVALFVKCYIEIGGFWKRKKTFSLLEHFIHNKQVSDYALFLSHTNADKNTDTQQGITHYRNDPIEHDYASLRVLQIFALSKVKTDGGSVSTQWPFE